MPWRPTGVSVDSWHMLAIFIATIFGCITQPIALVDVTLIGFTLTICVGLAPISDVIVNCKVVEKEPSMTFITLSHG